MRARFECPCGEAFEEEVASWREAKALCEAHSCPPRRRDHVDYATNPYGVMRPNRMTWQPSTA